MIKLDIINEVVGKTGITKTKAELAVETVFESMKKALAAGNRIELRGFGVLAAIPALGRKFPFLQDAPYVSSRAKNCSLSTESDCLSPIGRERCAGDALSLHSASP